VVALLETGSLRQIRRDLSRLHLGHIPGHHFAAPDVDHQVEVQPHATHTCWQVGDVPAPYLIRPPGLEPWHCTGFLWRTGSPVVVSLAWSWSTR